MLVDILIVGSANKTKKQYDNANAPKKLTS